MGKVRRILLTCPNRFSLITYSEKMGPSLPLSDIHFLRTADILLSVYSSSEIKERFNCPLIWTARIRISNIRSLETNQKSSDGKTLLRYESLFGSNVFLSSYTYVRDEKKIEKTRSNCTLGQADRSFVYPMSCFNFHYKCSMFVLRFKLVMIDDCCECFALTMMSFRLRFYLD